MAKIEKKEETVVEEKQEARYIYKGPNIMKNGFVIKHNSIYTEDAKKKIEKIENYSEIEEYFIDLNTYSKNY